MSSRHICILTAFELAITEATVVAIIPGINTGAVPVQAPTINTPPDIVPCTAASAMAQSRSSLSSVCRTISSESERTL